MGGSGVDEKIVIFNRTAEAKAIPIVFDTHHASAALQTNGCPRITNPAQWDGDDAIHALAKGETFARSAVETIAGEIFRRTFNRCPV
jgi:hypothetical protein